MNSFVLKMIGLLSMMIDHAGKLLFANEAWMMCLGRLAFPIFAYQTAMGYEKTRDLRRYAIRLAVFAMVSQVPYAIMRIMMGQNGMGLNIGFTLLFSVMALYCYDKMGGIWGAIMAGVVCMMAELMRVDYGAYGVVVTMIFSWLIKLTKDAGESGGWLIWQGAMVSAVFVLVTLCKYLPVMLSDEYGEVYGWNVVWTIVGLLAVLAHNGRRGLRCRYLFYVFYPVHMLVLCLIVVSTR